MKSFWVYKQRISTVSRLWYPKSLPTVAGQLLDQAFNQPLSLLGSEIWVERVTQDRRNLELRHFKSSAPRYSMSSYHRDPWSYSGCWPSQGLEFSTLPLLPLFWLKLTRETLCFLKPETPQWYTYHFIQLSPSHDSLLINKSTVYSWAP